MNIKLPALSVLPAWLHRVVWQMIAMLGFLLISLTAQATTCPANSRMYYVGANPPAGATSLPLAWTAQSPNRTFTFNDGTALTIDFPLLRSLVNDTDGSPPYYVSTANSYSDAGAIALRHSSTTVETNHTMSLTVNRPVLRAGFKIQDLDSFGHSTVGGFSYAERVDVSKEGGKLGYNPDFHTINASNDIVTAKQGWNCTTGECTIDATWGYRPANSPYSITHANTVVKSDGGDHANSYSDFYFCVAPPRLVTKKVLDGVRAQPNDQFTLTTKTGTTTVNSFTTTGAGSTIDAGKDSSGLITLNTTATYNITETIANGGSIANYTPTYVCTNNTASGTTMPSGTGSAFTLSGLKFGDEITCTITNTPKVYIFSGKVFDDGSVSRTANNGVFDTGELGIANTPVKITDCGSTELGATKTDASGNYSFTFSPSVLANISKVCLVETNLPAYPNDTSANTISITLAGANTYANNNFGDSKTGLLKLVKYQQVVACDAKDLAALDSGFTTANLGRTSTQSTNTEVPSGSCIAYKIEAINLGNIDLTNVVITDPLMNDAQRISKVYHTSAPKLCISGIATSNCDSTKVTSTVDGLTKTTTVQTTGFTIPGTGTVAQKKATLYFNTLYNLK